MIHIEPRFLLVVRLGGSPLKDSPNQFYHYYVTSTLGTVITVSTVNDDIQIIDKNQKPGWESPDQGKLVSATGNAADYGKTSTATVGDTVNFKITAYAPKYSGDKQVHTYTFEDTPGGAYFTLTPTNSTADITVAITYKASAGESAPESFGPLVAGTDYKITLNGNKFTVELYASAIANYPVEAHLTISYTAILNEVAVYDNVNTVSMDWTLIDPDEEDPVPPGEDDPKPPNDSKTDTYTYGFNLVKNDGTGTLLDGAEFRLYDAATSGNEIGLVHENAVYRVATGAEKGATGFVSAVIQAGTAKIFGLDVGTYYLEETKAPNGYNKLTERIPVTIAAANAATVTNPDTGAVAGYLNAPVTVVNQAGTLLPSTGGTGTTLFYVLGGLLAVGAVVLLITRKRMNREE